MVIRATIKLSDGTNRSIDFDSEEAANAWFEQVGAAQTYGDPATYTTETADVTQQVEDERDEAEGDVAQKIGSRCISRIYAVNKRKGLDMDALLALLQNPQLAIAERLLKNGALDSARTLIRQAGPAAGYTDAEVERIVAPITAVLG